MKSFLDTIFFRSNNLDYVSQNIKDLTKNTPANKIFDVINSFSSDSEIRYVGGCVRKIINKEKVAFIKYPKLKIIKLYLENSLDPAFVRMTGSGSSLVAYFQSKKSCERGKKRFNKKYKNYWCIASKTI